MTIYLKNSVFLRAFQILTIRYKDLEDRIDMVFKYSALYSFVNFFNRSVESSLTANLLRNLAEAHVGTRMDYIAGSAVCEYSKKRIIGPLKGCMAGSLKGSRIKDILDKIGK